MMASGCGYVAEERGWDWRKDESGDDWRIDEGFDVDNVTIEAWNMSSAIVKS